MAFDYEYPQRLDLDTYDVFLEQSLNDTSYIFIDKLPNILTYGKHFGALSWRTSHNAQYQLKTGTNILFELKDQLGNIIKTDLSNTLPVNGSAIFYVWVEKNPLTLIGDKYELTDGPCTLTVVYELENVPQKWQRKYNGRSTFQFELQKNLPNTSPILFHSSSLISSSLSISESLEVDTGDTDSGPIDNYERSVLHVSASNLKTEGGKLEFIEVSYNEEREFPSEFKLLTIYKVSGSGESFEKTSSEVDGLNPLSHIQKIVTPKDIRRNGNVTFRLRFLNSNEEVARNLYDNTDVVAHNTIVVTGSALLLETSDNLVHDSGGLFFGNKLDDGIKIKFDKGSGKEASRLVFQQFKDGTLDKEISRIDGTKHEYAFGDVTTNKIDTSSGSAIIGGFSNRITGSAFAGIINSTGSTITSASLSTIIGGKGNTIMALNDSGGLRLHPNIIIGARDSEITASQHDFANDSPENRLKGNTIVGGSSNKIHNGDDNAIVGSIGAEIESGTLGVYNSIIGSQACKIKGGGDANAIIASSLCTIGGDGSGSSVNSAIIIGATSKIASHDGAVLIGAGAPNSSAENTVFLHQLSSSGDIYVGGKLTANEFHTRVTSASIVYQSGSTQFGDSADDTHTFTGDITASGNISASGDITGDRLYMDRTVNATSVEVTAVNATGDISASGAIKGGSLDINGNADFGDGNITNVGNISVDAVFDDATDGDTRLTLADVSMVARVEDTEVVSLVAGKATFTGDISASEGVYIEQSASIGTRGTTTYMSGSQRGMFSVDYGSGQQISGSLNTPGDGYGDIVRIGAESSTHAGMIVSLTNIDQDNATQGTWERADANIGNISSSLLGINLGDTPENDGVLLRGFAKVNARGTMAAGQKVYVSTIGGDITGSAPSATGDIVRIVGYCLSGSTTAGSDLHYPVIYFNPDNGWVELS